VYRLCFPRVNRIAPARRSRRINAKIKIGDPAWQSIQPGKKSSQVKHRGNQE
jgi:hypothetical protein